jgi:hypothetical protein
VIDGAAIASQPEKIHTQTRAQAAACIALDANRLTLPQSLHHLSKADAAYSAVHIQP